MEYKVGVISGDGIGPEIVTEAKKVLDKIADKYGHSFNYTDILMGGCSIGADGFNRWQHSHITMVQAGT